MRKFLGFFLVWCVLCVFGVGACSNSAPEKATAPGVAPAPGGQSAGMRSVRPTEAATMIKERKDLLVVDVRTQGELANGMIEGSVVVPFWAVMKGEHALPRDKALLLVCAVGGRSYAAGQVLASNGYRDVYNLSGGISAWRNAGLPLK